MAGVYIHKSETFHNICPDRFFNAFACDHQLIPRIAPGHIREVQIVQGNGGAGTEKIICLGDDHQFNSVRHRIDEVDIQRRIYKYTLTDSDFLHQSVEKIEYEHRFVPKGGGFTVQNTITYHPIGAVQIREEHNIRAGIEWATGRFDVVGAHLLQNPQAYMSCV